ncbi:ABC transporter ATP-binding protein [Pyxidicoccus parkwayensis]|uniref:ABC transporter ATP-binding protein n=1 Tax=Pyxidicoccus parkwayensis TaxID=2813578 RepID=A0ABX7NX36_9BACT|nr:ABC transporter ATP-binding protein [Pyxidicoccus parkwaysis]QSQ21964.1 ABC transporter ATP-binding protein [Pyxidicoccus parkwaysis]
MAIVEMRDIHKSYQLGKTTVEALRGVSLDVEEGEFTVVMGPSGSGKTTLLNIIGCLDQATHGSYKLEGREIGDRDFNELAELRNRKIGFIFQAFNLIPVLNVLENIEFPCLIRNESRASLRARALSIAKDVGLSHVLKHRPDELSGGQRQRVAIARALVTQPQIVLADEPTANLDSVTSEQILDLMEELNRMHQVTFLFSTHDPRVMKRARRVVQLADGYRMDDATHAHALELAASAR